MLSDLTSAKTYFLKALEIEPNDLYTHNSLANVYQQQHNAAAAEKHFQKALEINPNSSDIYFNLANLFKAQGQFEKAGKQYQRAIDINPLYAKAHNNLAICLFQQKQWAEAEKWYKKAIDTDPDYVDAYHNLANLLKGRKYFNQAKEFYQKALSLNVNYLDARLNLSLLQLLILDFEAGWKNYECRYHSDNKDRETIPPTTLIPHYQGEDLTGKNLLVYPEQGFGDEIQFIRFLPLLKSQKGVKNLVLVCKPALKSLFSSMACIDHVLSTDEFANAKLQGIDYWVFIMSLPLHFNTVLESIPKQLPYLTASALQQDQWQNRLPAKTTTDFRIGLVWKGSKAHKNDANRSLPSLQALQPLWEVKEALHGSVNLHFISLQKGEGEDEAANPPVGQDILHLGSDIQDFSDSAAIISQLDLVICVDTAIAHLAGSLNIPCWVLLPYYGTDWRWFEDRNDSPWYPEVMKLFRQSKDEDWGAVIKQVANDLRQKI